MMTDDFTQAESAAQFIRSQTQHRPEIALVLGSGLGAFADELSDAVRIPYAQIPSFPRSTAIGHAGRMVIGKTAGVAVAAMQGRTHLYEGYSAKEVSFPIRVLRRWAIKARHPHQRRRRNQFEVRAGRARRAPRSHQPAGTESAGRAKRRPLRPALPRHVASVLNDLSRDRASEAAKLGMTLHDGVYAALLGPSYETPAEIRYLRTIGADLVGMSTVAEVIAARHMGLNVMAISCRDQHGIRNSGSAD